MAVTSPGYQRTWLKMRQPLGYVASNPTSPETRAISFSPKWLLLQRLAFGFQARNLGGTPSCSHKGTNTLD